MVTLRHQTIYNQLVTDKKKFQIIKKNRRVLVSEIISSKKMFNHNY